MENQLKKILCDLVGQILKVSDTRFVKINKPEIIRHIFRIKKKIYTFM